MLTSLYMLSLTVLITFLVLVAVEKVQSLFKKKNTLSDPSNHATPVLEVNQQG
ncbi:hypothetical protein [Halobacillus seohaensis]|uniref:Uncharacterized protein n=1 Tax=Halobacillus seohaensis TaxID=447421 RepID=A0ABW2EF43_9BACI